MHVVPEAEIDSTWSTPFIEPLSLIPPGKEKMYVGLGIRAGKSASEAD